MLLKLKCKEVFLCRKWIAITIYRLLNIPFPSNREATIAYDVLRVDAEPKRSGVSKNLSVEGSTLKVVLSSLEARQLRVAVHSFLDYLVLATETMKQFGPPKSQEYSYKSPSPIKI